MTTLNASNQLRASKQIRRFRQSWFRCSAKTLKRRFSEMVDIAAEKGVTLTVDDVKGCQTG